MFPSRIAPTLLRISELPAKARFLRTSGHALDKASPVRRPPLRTSNSSRPSIARQNFDYFLVLDFEATCEAGTRIQPCQEIIEFPVLLLDGKTFEEVSRFHKYVRPTECPELTTFCSQLTGIIQEMVDNQPTLPEVLGEFDRWLQERKVHDSRFVFVTCGDWDLQLQLTNEANYKGLAIPGYFSQWINIKKSFCSHRGYFAQGMKQLLREFELLHTGRHHSGIDDVTNIAAITKALAQEGYVYEINGGARRGRVFGFWSKMHEPRTAASVTEK